MHEDTFHHRKLRTDSSIHPMNETKLHDKNEYCKNIGRTKIEQHRVGSQLAEYNGTQKTEFYLGSNFAIKQE